MNKAILVGRLTRNPEARDTQGGTKVCKFALAINRRGKDGGTDYINCTAFGKTAELAAQYLSKGSRAGVVGRIQTGSYERDGHKVYTTDVIADEVEFLETRAEAQRGRTEDVEAVFGAPPQVTEDDDDLLPF